MLYLKKGFDGKMSYSKRKSTDKKTCKMNEANVFSFSFNLLLYGELWPKRKKMSYARAFSNLIENNRTDFGLKFASFQQVFH